ncbi:MAG: TolC family protein [Verrucomicrobiae bacterium]|nr:TolC family protein [Verrucomicrobiae bacterium]|tara:strand:- start:2452 stop:4116 length:1665 start_codon:yes stop_codon:yes gene_type:complete
MMVYVIILMLGTFLNGCSTKHYERSANREAASLIAEKTPLVANMDSGFKLEKSDPTDLIDLPKHETIEPFLGPTGESELGARIISLEKAVELATKYNRRFLSQKEDLYLQALDLSLARFQYTPIFGGGADIAYTDRQRIAENTATGVDNITREKTVNSNAGLGFNWLLRTGGRIATDFSTDFVRFVSNDSEWFTSSALGATFTQPFLRGAGYRIAIENLTQAERNLLYALRDFTRFRKEFTVDIVANYYQILQNRDRVRNAFQGYESFKVSVEREQARAAEGETPLSELNRLKESLLSTEQGWISAIRNYQLSRDRFKIDLGLSMDTSLILDESELDNLVIHHPSITASQAIKASVETRLDLENVRDRLQDVERRIRIAADGLQADLDLTVSGNVSSRPGSGFQLPDLDQRSWTASLGIDLPINRKRERNNYRSALIAFDRAQRQYDQFVDQMKLDIQDGWRNLEQRRREFEISEVRVELSQNRREEELLKRELGLGLALDLVDAQNDLINSQNQRTSALISHTIARLGFWRDMGILFIKENGQWEELGYETLE